MKQHSNKSQHVAAYYWRQAKRYPRLLVGVLIVLPLTILINGYLPPLILASVLTRLSQHHFEAGHIWSSFGWELVIYASLLLIGILAWRTVDFFAWRLEMRIQKDMAEEVFTHLLRESADFHANSFAGSLVSQTNKLVSGYVRVADTTMFQVIPMTAGLFWASVILLPRSPLFVAFLIVFTVCYMLVAFKISKPVQKLSAKYATAESEQTGYLADAVSNVMAIKSFARFDYELKRFQEATTNTRDRLFDFARLHRKQMNLLGTLSRSISSASLFIAVVSVMTFHANIATVFLILSYTQSIVEQLFQFSNNSLRNYNRAFGDAKDMVDILAQTPEVQDPETPEPLRVRNGSIEFKDVTFTHKGSQDALFDGLNLKLKHGEKVGLVGHSGSGKSTFTRVLQRFSDIDSGQILIDGQSISAITQEDLHGLIAYVPQEPLLFHRSIRENIAYGQLDAPEEAVIQVARYAHAAEFIDLLPDGYETLVGERGVKLSGGQRQRIAIARAMLKNAPILVLDEATSALDSESEGLIQDALWKLMDNRTAIVIAHRLSTIQAMDRIIVLEDGKIVEQGSHKELLRKGGVYAQLWQRQSGGFIDDDDE